MMWTFDVFFAVRLNKRLSKQSRRRWFETPSRSLWRYCNEVTLNAKWQRPYIFRFKHIDGIIAIRCTEYIHLRVADAYQTLCLPSLLSASWWHAEYIQKIYVSLCYHSFMVKPCICMLSTRNRHTSIHMMTTWHGNAFHHTGRLIRKSRHIPFKQSSVRWRY